MAWHSLSKPKSRILYKALGLVLKDEYEENEMMHKVQVSFTTEASKDLLSEAREIAIFELIIDGLFTMFDLNESNALDKEEFKTLISQLKKCC